jgi:hypothetical protein
LGFAVGAQAQQQTKPPYNIPLKLVTVPDDSSKSQRLLINIGIKGGAPQPYLFDTGSALFNAAYNPAWWDGVKPWTPGLPMEVKYCYGHTTGDQCRGFLGNLTEVPSLSFYTPGVTEATNPIATLPASPGYIVNAARFYNWPKNKSHPFFSFPNYFDTASIPVPFFQGLFNGVFGAGNFTTIVKSNSESIPPESPPPPPCTTSTSSQLTTCVTGGVLGQTVLKDSVAAQGYVVAANNGATQEGQSQHIPASLGADKLCSPCVTVGLTNEVLGQFFAVGLPFSSQYPANAIIGVVPVWDPNAIPFNNAGGLSARNNASTEFAAKFSVSITPPGDSPITSGTLLDSGTPDLELSTKLQKGVSTVVDGKKVYIKGGRISVVGVAAASTMRLPSWSEDLTYDKSPESYEAHFSESDINVLGIGFFLRNSVMYDLSHNVIGYTPFFVTDSSVSTETGALVVNGPQSKDSPSVPLGVAGAISGKGGVIINDGGQLQLSADNTYNGRTEITSHGQLNISGPGGITYSKGVTADGVFDISRAWTVVSISELNGSGQVNLGSQNLTITKARGTFSGIIGDGGSYPGTGGSLTIASGSMMLTGANSYTGGTSVLPNGTLQGTTKSLRGKILNLGTLAFSQDTSESFSGAISGTGFLGVMGSGTVTISADITQNTVLVWPDSTLVVNGSVRGSVYVLGQLSGGFTIEGEVKVDGTIMPSSQSNGQNSVNYAPEAAKIVGNFFQGQNSKYEVVVSDQTASQIIVTGNATMNGVVYLFETGSPSPGSSFTILSALEIVGCPRLFASSSWELACKDKNTIILTKTH